MKERDLRICRVRSNSEGNLDGTMFLIVEERARKI